MRLLGLLPLLLLGCGSPPNNCTNCGKDMTMPPSPDMTTPSPDMTSPPDLAPPPDLASAVDFAGFTFCPNTAVAGTCVQAFFTPVATCFDPMGACTESTDMMTFGNFCWQNGAKLLANLGNMSMPHGTWKNGNTTCMEGDVQPMNGPVFTLKRGGQTLIYDEATGAVTCPDGSMINIGANDGGCPALHDILNPPVNNCTPGNCA